MDASHAIDESPTFALSEASSQARHILPDGTGLSRSAVQPPPQDAERPATGAGLDAAEAGPALSVTRLGPISGVGIEPESVPEPRVLLAGIDTLDLGLDVSWGDGWPSLVKDFDEGKELAAGTKGYPNADRECLIHPSGKPPNYRWHLEWPKFHLFIGKSGEPNGKTPNVYASLNSQTLWQMTLSDAVGEVTRTVEAFGGRVLAVKPSRCDLAADFEIPGGLSLDFLRQHRVPRHVQHSDVMSGDALETFYHGAKSSPIQLRIYDKGREVRQGGTKYWFFQVWGTHPEADIWRVEFQLRRPYLKECGISTLDELREKLGGLWEYLTGDWFSLRLDDDSNVTRRTVHPWWRAVHACAPEFGPSTNVRRDFTGVQADSGWYVSHCAGCLVGFAARERLDTYEAALAALDRLMRDYWRRHNFERQYAVKSIQLGHSVVADVQSCPSVSDVKEDA